MKILDISYASWKVLVQKGGWSQYHVDHIDTDKVIVYSGTIDYVLKCYITDAFSFSDWTSAFTESVQVESGDEALAKIIENSLGEKYEDPRTSDGRRIFLPAIYRGSIDPMFIGSDDDGNPFLLHWIAPPLLEDTKFMEWGFHDWIYVGKGLITFKNAGPGDQMTVTIKAPATVTSSTPGTGNCNKVPIGGGVNILVPAPGNDGTHTVQDTDKVPVPASNEDGYWDWDTPDIGKGLVSAGVPGASLYHLMDQDIYLVKWIRDIQLIGDGSKDLDPKIKSRRILPHWIFRVDVTNKSLSLLQVAWRLDGARAKTT